MSRARFSWLLLISVMVAGCNAVVPLPGPDVKPTPVVELIALGDLCEAIADAVPGSICDSDQLELTLEELVLAGKLSATQKEQIRSVVANTKPPRPLTDQDSKAIRSVK